MSIRNEILRNTGKILFEADSSKPAKAVAAAYDKGSKELSKEDKGIDVVDDAWQNLRNEITSFAVGQNGIGVGNRISKAYISFQKVMSDFIKKNELEE